MGVFLCTSGLLKTFFLYVRKHLKTFLFVREDSDPGLKRLLFKIALYKYSITNTIIILDELISTCAKSKILKTTVFMKNRSLIVRPFRQGVEKQASICVSQLSPV